MVLVPNTAPTMVAPASDMKASSEFCSSSFSSTYPAWRPTEYRVPAVSKMSTNRNATMTIMKSAQDTPSPTAPMPASPKAAMKDSSGKPATSNSASASNSTAVTPLYGSEAPSAQPPMMVVPKIPYIIAPFIPLAIIMAMASRQIIAQISPFV